MITHKLYGGLGNQLFQICTVIALSLKSGHEFYFEWVEDSLLVKSSFFKQLIVFCKSSEECRALENHLQIHRITEPESHVYDPHCFDSVMTASNHEHLFFLEGYFQSYMYFQNEFSEIVRMLDIDKQLEQFVNIENMTTITKRIMLHFRLGDYKYLQHTHVILPCDYYRNAIQHILDIIQKNEPSTNASNFSGDPSLRQAELAKAQLLQASLADRRSPLRSEKSVEQRLGFCEAASAPLPDFPTINVVYVFQKNDQEIVEKYYIKRLSSWFPQCTWTSIYTSTPLSDEQQLLYMSLSKYHVMANSTFSLWSAYLNRNKNPCICYPKYWFTNNNDILWKAQLIDHELLSEDQTPSTMILFNRGNYYEIKHQLITTNMFFPEWNQIDISLNNTSDCVDIPNLYIQCLCYNNPKKYENMARRFDTIGLPLDIFHGVSFYDERILNIGKRKNPLAIQRLWSVTYGHLDMIQRFINTNKPYGIFCEDDIMVNRTLPVHLLNIMEECTIMKLDILLLGYMITQKIEDWMSDYKEIECVCGQRDEVRPYKYHDYPDNQWGVHMYMLSHEGAKKIIETYANGYADNPENVFSPDWTISKCPGLKRAIIYPMFAVEDGADLYEHYGHTGQYNFHMDTFKSNYIPDVFI